jgi:hypothetical protein
MTLARKGYECESFVARPAYVDAQGSDDDVLETEQNVLAISAPLQTERRLTQQVF